MPNIVQKYEDIIRDNPASYLDIAEFISNYGANIEANLHQLWRRIILNIAISNTDDHLRNHGFILTKGRLDTVTGIRPESINRKRRFSPKYRYP